MTPKKPQNSILVIATLGVYLGLLLAGATPQVLAQAAMTRQFDVKDEIEVKEDLDTKPDVKSVSSATENDVPSTILVSSSINRFLSQFQPKTATGAFLAPPTSSFAVPRSHSYSCNVDPIPNDVWLVLPEQTLTISNLPRAGLDVLLASNAK